MAKTGDERFQDQELNKLNTTFVEGRMMDDMREWIEQLSGHEFKDQHNWVAECDNGLVLLKLLESIDKSLINIKYNKRPNHFWAKRDNLNLVVDTLKEKMELEVIFEIGDLLQQEDTETINLSNVMATLDCLAIYCYEKYGIAPPGEKRATREVEAEEEKLQNTSVDEIAEKVMLTLSAKSLPRDDDDEVTPQTPASPVANLVYEAVQGDEIDQAVEKAMVDRQNSNLSIDQAMMGLQIIRLKQGQYLLMPHKKIFFMRILSGKLMVRVGGGWEVFDSWFSRLKTFKSQSIEKPGLPMTELDRKVSNLAQQAFRRKGSSSQMDRKGSFQHLQRAPSYSRTPKTTTSSTATPEVTNQKAKASKTPGSDSPHGPPRFSEAPPSPSHSQGERPQEVVSPPPVPGEGRLMSSAMMKERKAKRASKEAKGKETPKHTSKASAVTSPSPVKPRKASSSKASAASPAADTTGAESSRAASVPAASEEPADASPEEKKAKKKRVTKPKKVVRRVHRDEVISPEPVRTAARKASDLNFKIVKRAGVSV